MTTKNPPIDLRCGYRVHAKIFEGKYLSIRCNDHRCPQALWARESGQYCFHYWDWSTIEYDAEGNITKGPVMRTFYEPNPKAA